MSGTAVPKANSTAAEGEGTPVSRVPHRRLTRRALLGAGVAALAAPGAPVFAAESDFSRPVRIVVVYPPGGGIDLLARNLGQRLSAEWKVPVIVDNRPGAGTTIGAAAVAKAPPDGHTLLMTDVSFAITPSLYEKLPYDPVRSFAPISLINLVADVLVVHPDVPARDTKELIDLARRKPGSVSYASAGIGTLNHLAPDMLRAMTGIQVLHVPYNGALAALNDVIAGREQFYIGALNSTLPHIRSGRLRALAVTGARRSPLLPDVPTIAESAVPGYDVAAWYGMLAPAHTPAAMVERISRDLARLLREPAFAQTVESDGNEIVASSPSDFSAFIDSEIAKWGKAAAEATSAARR
ncbi:Argininosuccinate lyase [Variovorax sp. PBS-H4]|uniref:tripartite tricarboxylate transporter substrate binding protein n=1 Tax=Variovorax sp. PBS-H4 TaxID=434008 RepID=UPI0013184A70|nr:tripartite tricarboxylate transporter substrate binding protein [Variovorax sp. PBS-H4]VTU36609.1 Argininosuccinate lyase [Variovorax sp. PBS-H4]